MRDILENYYKQIEEGYKLGGETKFSDFDKIFVCGMGGSAIPGEILKSFLHNKFPVFICKEYQIPEYLDDKSLVFLVSYSGNTEETLEAAEQVLGKTKKIICICSGGKLEEFSGENKISLVKVPVGLQPRMAYGYQFFAIFRILENSGLIKEDIVELIETVKSHKSFEAVASVLAKKLKGKIPLAYSSEAMRAVSYKWKIDFNENCKILAFSNVIPEQNHNEINGFVNLNGNYHVFIIEDSADHPRIKKRYSVIKKLIEEKGVSVDIVKTRGQELLTRIISGIYLGDWVSFLLAKETGVDPTPVKIIEDLKKML